MSLSTTDKRTTANDASVDSHGSESEADKVATFSGGEKASTPATSDDEAKEAKKAKSKSKKKKPAKTDVFGDVQFGGTLDPFANGGDPFAGEGKKDTGAMVSAIHIRVQQRNARKSTTTLQGLDERYNLKKLVKHFKKTFGCLGTIVNDEKYGEVIQLSGDQRAELQTFLVDEGIARDRDITVHGF